MKAILQLFGQNQAQEFMPDSAQTPEMESADQYGPWINENSLWANLNHPVVRDYFDTYSVSYTHLDVYKRQAHNSAYFVAGVHHWILLVAFPLPWTQRHLFPVYGWYAYPHLCSVVTYFYRIQIHASC